MRRKRKKSFAGRPRPQLWLMRDLFAVAAFLFVVKMHLHSGPLYILLNKKCAVCNLAWCYFCSYINLIVKQHIPLFNDIDVILHVFWATSYAPTRSSLPVFECICQVVLPTVVCILYMCVCTPCSINVPGGNQLFFTITFKLAQKFTCNLNLN